MSPLGIYYIDSLFFVCYTSRGLSPKKGMVAWKLFHKFMKLKEKNIMVDNITPDETLDCKGLSCPMPLLKAKKAIGKMESGQVLEILGTDPGTKNDLPAFAKKAGHDYLGEKDDEGFTRFYIKVK